MGIEEILIEDARQEGLEEGIEKGIILLVSNVIKKHPEWSDEKIADLPEVTVDTVVSVRNSFVTVKQK